MHANRFTAVLDACVLVPPLTRNILLSLADADLYRVRVSQAILTETERNIARLLERHGYEDHGERGTRAVAAIVAAFEDDLIVEDFDRLLDAADGVDPKDAHVVAAAIKTKASVIVTDNLKDFPEATLTPFELEAKSADAFIADTINLDETVSITALREMRARLTKKPFTSDELILKMERNGLLSSAAILSSHVDLL